MQAPRRLVAVLGTAAALVGLAGCERPTPLVTLFSGTTSLYDHAWVYCFEGQDPAAEPGTPGACRFDTQDRTQKVLEVEPGDEVLVDVDRDLVHTGWFVALRPREGDAQRLATQTEHVTRFVPDFNRSATYVLEIRKLENPRDDARPTGLWQFALVPK